MSNHYQHRAFLAFCAVILHISTSGGLFADDSRDKPSKLSPEKKKLADELISSIKKHREGLRSGVFTANEFNTSTDPKRGKQGTVKRSATLFSAFDYDKKLFRYDYEHETLHQSKRYFRTSKMSALYSPDTLYLILMKPNNSQYFSPTPLNVRAIGFSSMNSLERRRTFSTVYKWYTQTFDVDDVRKETSGNYRLTLSGDVRSGGRPTGARVEVQLWIEPANGFTPVRFQRRFLNPKTERWKATTVCKTTWAKRAGVWVPTSVESASYGRTKWRLDLTWKSVNKGVDSGLFEWKSLKPKKGTRVVDQRSGQPVLIERIGE